MPTNTVLNLKRKKRNIYVSIAKCDTPKFTDFSLLEVL